MFAKNRFDQFSILASGLLLLATLVTAAPVVAQTVLFDKTWNGSYSGDGQAVAVDSFGNTYVGGVLIDAILGDQAALIKYDIMGNLVWQRGLTQGGQVAGLVVDSGGNAYVAIPYGINELLIKVDGSTGDFIWQRVWGGDFTPTDVPNEFSVCNAAASDLPCGIMAIDFAGNVYMAGTGQGDAGVTSGGYALSLVKFDGAGNLLWQRQWGKGSSAVPRVSSLAVSPAGDVYIGAQPYVIRYDASGNLIWDKFFNMDQFPAVAVDPAGNLFVAGGAFTGSGSFIGIRLRKYDPAGNLLWVQVWDNGTSPSVTSIAVSPFGNVYVVGIQGQNAPTQQGIHGYVLRYDANGNLIWQRNYGGTNDYDFPQAVAADGLGRVYVAGSTANATRSFGVLNGTSSPGTDPELPAGGSSIALADGFISTTYAWDVLNGSETFNGNSAAFLLVVQDYNTTVTSSANPSVFNQSVTFTAAIGPIASGGVTPTGTVTFSDGATTLGTSSLSGGQATFSTSSLLVGSHSITAAYGGDTNFTVSSGSLTQTVNQTATGTAISSSPNPAVAGQPVTFTATVSPLPPGSGTPTGSVTFTDGATTLGTAGLNGSGQAMVTVLSLLPGSHSIAGQYTGDSNFASSSSAGTGGGGGYTQTVNRASTATALSSSSNPSISNQPVTLTANISVVSPGSGTPTGSVTFQDGSNVLGTVGLSTSGSASFTTSSLVVNAHSITVTYSGDSNFSGSISSTLTQRVQYEPTGITCYGDVGHQILQPINADGTSVWKQGRTIPVKFRVCDANGVSIGTSGVVSSFVRTQIVSGTVTTVNETISATTADPGFRFDTTAQQWIFNLSTQNESAGFTYIYSINLNDGTSIVFQYGLR